MTSTRRVCPRLLPCGCAATNLARARSCSDRDALPQRAASRRRPLHVNVQRLHHQPCAVRERRSWGGRIISSRRETYQWRCASFAASTRNGRAVVGASMRDARTQPGTLLGLGPPEQERETLVLLRRRRCSDSRVIWDPVTGERSWVHRRPRRGHGSSATSRAPSPQQGHAAGTADRSCSCEPRRVKSAQGWVCATVLGTTSSLGHTSVPWFVDRKRGRSAAFAIRGLESFT